jgi:hypothetical protein
LLEKLIEMKPTTIFLRFALHCAKGAIGERLSQAEYDALTITAVKDEEVDTKKLETFFPTAVERMETNYPDRNIWAKEVILDYFCNSVHNRIIAGLIAPESKKEDCMVHIAQVINIEGDILHVTYQGSELLSEQFRGERKTKVQNPYLPETKVGDRVLIHRGYASYRENE